MQTVKDGKEALEVLAKDSFDLVVSDINMPNVDGKQLFESFHEDHPEVPFIFLSSSAHAKMKEQLKGLGAIAVLEKVI